MEKEETTDSPGVAENLVDDPTVHQLYEQSINTIGTLLNMSMWTLAILALAIAIIAVIVGFGIRNAAKQIANNAVNNYIKSGEFKVKFEEQMEKAIRERTQNAIFVAAPEKREGDETPFEKGEIKE